MNKQVLWAAGCFAAVCFSAPAQSATIVLDFEGVGDFNLVDDFYNGGAGPNYGVGFSNARAFVDFDAGGNGSQANEPSADTIMAYAAIMNVAAGFDTGFSFFYSSGEADGFAVNVYDGLNGSGNLLATLNLAYQFDIGCTGDPTGEYCNWTPIGVTFAGTAMSVDFGTPEFMAFDNITLGSEIAVGGVVPEPPPGPS